MNKVKILVLFTVFIDIIGIGVIIPTLPFYVESFGVSDTVVALLFSIYAFLSFLSAPFLGLISDRYGRRPVLIISILSSAIGWIVFAGAKNIWLLFLGRSIDGIAAGNISTAQSSLSDISKNSTERSTNMGLIGAMFGIGLIIGPLIGGLLSVYGNTAPFWFVGILSLINTILAYFFLPETHKERTNTKIKINPISPIIDGFKNIEMRKIFLIFFSFGLAITIQQTIFGLYTARAFGFNSKTIGMVMGFIGFIILINQLFLLKNVWLKIWNNKILTKVMFFILATGMIISSLKIIALFFIGIILTTISQSNLRGTLMSTIAGQNKEKTGEYIGISTSIMSLSMILGPLLASAVYIINISIPFILAGIISLLCIPIYINIIKKINI